MSLREAPLWPVQRVQQKAVPNRHGEQVFRIGISSSGLTLVNSYYQSKYIDAYEWDKKWKSLNERREDWWEDISKHPRSSLLFEEKLEHYPVCPHCGYEDDDYYGVSEDSETHTCNSCDVEFSVNFEIFHGIKSKPMECKNGRHEFVFSSQYYYGPETSRYCAGDGEDGHNVRIFDCIHCGAANYNMIHTDMLPWLDDYNDPDYFDPDGALKPDEGYDPDKPTPVLDLLFGDTWPAWHRQNGAVERALAKHEKHYGVAV